MLRKIKLAVVKKKNIEVDYPEKSRNSSFESIKVSKSKSKDKNNNKNCSVNDELENIKYKKELQDWYKTQTARICVDKIHNDYCLTLHMKIIIDNETYDLCEGLLYKNIGNEYDSLFESSINIKGRKTQETQGSVFKKVIYPVLEKKIPGIVHFETFEDLTCAVNETKIDISDILNEKNCSVLNCYLGEKSKANSETSNNLKESIIKTDPSVELEKYNNALKKNCVCNVTGKLLHYHGKNCDHPVIVHNDHLDFIMNDGSLHHPSTSGKYCIFHGKIKII